MISEDYTELFRAPGLVCVSHICCPEVPILASKAACGNVLSSDRLTLFLFCKWQTCRHLKQHFTQYKVPQMGVWSGDREE